MSDKRPSIGGYGNRYRPSLLRARRPRGHTRDPGCAAVLLVWLAWAAVAGTGAFFAMREWL